ncbi:hypothetical protein ABEB36_006542 [Hypothenemus hampei]|uniref:Uncharacterized protein n=1 Tax=Hypothenemus hampei TaxID=57062 RepID=A0ABD1ERM5_HYPHA
MKFYPRFFLRTKHLGDTHIYIAVPLASSETTILDGPGTGDMVGFGTDGDSEPLESTILEDPGLANVVCIALDGISEPLESIILGLETANIPDFERDDFSEPLESTILDSGTANMAGFATDGSSEPLEGSFTALSDILKHHINRKQDCTTTE